MNAITPVAKLGKLIRLFGSDQDGEVLGAVRAADRALKANGLDWHAIADALEREPETRTVVVYRDPNPSEPKTWRALAEWCRRHGAGRLKAHERAFIADMAHRLVLNGEPTEKQATWLRTIYARLHREGAQ